MMFIDTHAHLYSEQFSEDQTAMIQRALDAGVKKMFLPNIDQSSIEGMEYLVQQFPDVCYGMMGIHPCDIAKDWKNQLTSIKKHFVKGRHIAIGEIGIDLYWDKTLIKEQMDAFAAQIEWAKSEQLPIVIHARDSFDEIFEIVDTLNDESLTGIFHCFTGNEVQAKRILNYGGFKLGIGGVVTFKNSGLDKVLQNVPLTDLVLETDAPYLAPVPYRGKRNESAYIPIIAAKLSAIYEVDTAEIARITTQNALTLFKLNADE